MNVDLHQFSGACRCGEEHRLLTKYIRIEKGIVAKLGEIVDSLGLPKRCCIVCDSNTNVFAALAGKALGDRLHPLRPAIVLNPDNLHADEIAVERVMTQLAVDTGWLLAVGSGTIHDVTRYVATQKGIPFVSFPTAASVDGFVSTVCAMTWKGFKTTIIGSAPVAVIADTDIFANAPYRLTASGIGDVLGKYTALADWEIAHILTGEPICRDIYAISEQAVREVRENLDGIRAMEPEACEKLLHALLMTGIAMQLWNDSRPASGSEHHFSHFWEMERINKKLDALHGEKVGIGLLLAMDYYHRLGEVDDIASHLVAYSGLPEEGLRRIYGELFESTMEENTPDPLPEIDRDTLIEKWPQIAAVLRGLPDLDELRADMKKAACMTELEQIGLDASCIADSATYSPYVRNRMTAMRLRKLTDL
ncbi:sn-glycerol-1-phosphate dehydrogenase [Ruminococcaceae bacterium OttesenSCG-928-L11]|nr:sn-glycerol-1-phosphate dehydrogenase [Ruminococcaceae bacterium OttesenSCG-928-L11]